MVYYPFSKIEKKWQQYWLKNKIFSTKETSRGKPFYCLDMFPYPSAAGLHVGHLRGYTISDVISKKKMMEGYNVLHPMGWDAFGLPAENYAIKTGIHPAITTRKAIANIKKQLIRSGLGYDWTREINTSSKDYYKFTQWLFVTLFKNGLAYKKVSPVNFCPSCKTVLAREQVIEGKCERCSSVVEKRDLEQWFFRITNYAERLLNDLDKINWPEKIKTMQRNWIGKSDGVLVNFEIDGTNIMLNVFTTRIDTIFGCTYLVIAPEHAVLNELAPKISNWDEVRNYIEKARKKTEIERGSKDKEKSGLRLDGIYAINPINSKKIPVFVGDYVLPDYATGILMGVPAHDQRDFEFAKKYHLEITSVISPKDGASYDGAFEGEGVLINSGPFNGLDSKRAQVEILRYLEKKKLAKRATFYKIRDWCISRQRYWGAPIPIIYCKNCGTLAVPENRLPVILPQIKDFIPRGDGKSPLAKVERFLKTKCPKCHQLAERETDTMDTFVCSSWYYLRYVDPKNKKEFASRKKIKKWLPVQLYIGGAEHAVMHLLYARFICKVLFDLKYLSFDEPFYELFNQGTIYYQGAKMSKSKGNVVNPDQIIETYGADTLRLYELFMGPADQATEWSQKGVKGCFRFLNRVWRLKDKVAKGNGGDRRTKLAELLHFTVKKVTEEIEHFKFNTAISSMMVLANEMEKEERIPVVIFKDFIKMLAPFAPHIAEELWHSFGEKKSVFKTQWPRYKPYFPRQEKITFVIQINGRVRDRIEIPPYLTQTEIEQLSLSREKIRKWILGKPIKKVFFVPQKLINFVV